MVTKRTIEECIKNLTSMSNSLSPEFEMDLLSSIDYLKEYKKILNKDSTKTKEIDEFFNSIWKLYPNKKGKTAISLSKKKKLMNEGYDKIKLAISNYKKDPDLKSNGGFKEYLQGSTFFNGRYMDYLSSDDQLSIKPDNLNTQTKFRKKDL